MPWWFFTTPGISSSRIWPPARMARSTFTKTSSLPTITFFTSAMARRQASCLSSLFCHSFSARLQNSKKAAFLVERAGFSNGLCFFFFHEAALHIPVGVLFQGILQGAATGRFHTCRKAPSQGCGRKAPDFFGNRHPCEQVAKTLRYRRLRCCPPRCCQSRYAPCPRDGRRNPDTSCRSGFQSHHTGAPPSSSQVKR